MPPDRADHKNWADYRVAFKSYVKRLECKLGIDRTAADSVGELTAKICAAHPKVPRCRCEQRALSLLVSTALLLEGLSGNPQNWLDD